MNIQTFIKTAMISSICMTGVNDLCFAQTTICPGDTALLILNSYRGSIQWQQSTDSTTWDSIPGATSDTAQVIINNTTWYRAKVIESSCQPVYSGIKKFIIVFCCGTDSIQDADGNWYQTVLIGTQCWMAENLNVGTQIAPAGNQTDNAVIEKYCHGGVNSDSTEGNCSVWGGLYQWDEMMQYDTIEGIQGICPTGWHLPAHDEYTELERAVCTSGTCTTDFPYDNTTTGWRGTNEGDKLKTAADCITCDGSEGNSGFEALLAGYRDTDGLFYFTGAFTYMWSSTESGTNAWSRSLFVSEARVYRNIDSKLNGFSVRCLKDCPRPATPDTINGSTNVNKGQTGISYSISPVPGATSYTWTVPPGAIVVSGQGTDSITVDFDSIPGNICVTANNSCGTSSASCLAVTVFNCGIDSVQDVEGNWYQTVLIGTQCWMAENLNVGTQVAPAGNQTDNAVIEKYCHGGVHQDNTEGDCSVWGGLYQWDEMMQYDTIEGIQGICPTGWHLPAHDEYTELERAVCTSGTCTTDFPYDNTTTVWRGTNEGDKLKTADVCFICDGTKGNSDFEALLAGIRHINGDFYNSGVNALFWSSTESDAFAWRRYLYSFNAAVSRNTNSKLYGYSVRCLKD